MKTRAIRTLSLILVLASVPLWAAQSAKKTLDHAQYDQWRTVSSAAFAQDGSWLLYRIAPVVGDGEVTVRNSANGTEYKIPRGTAPRFTFDGKYVLATILPAKAEVDQAKKDKKPARDMPKNALGILDLATGKLTTIEKVRTWRIADEGSTWIAYSIDDGSTAGGPAAGAAGARPGGARPGGGRPGGAAGAAGAQPTTPPVTAPAEPQDPSKPKKKSDHAVGTELILRNIATGEEKKLADVAESAFSEDGARLAYAVSAKDGEGDKLVVLNLADGKETDVMKGLGRYVSLTFSKDGKLGFSSDRDEYSADQSGYHVYVWNGSGDSTEIAKEGTAGVRSGYWPTRGALRFSESGKRLFFPTQPKPKPEPKDAPTVADDEKVDVDIWHWKDPQVQPQQLLQATAERNRSYTCVAFLDSGKVVQLEDPDLQSVQISDRSDGPVGLGSTNLPYRVESTWAPGVSDVFVVDPSTGARKRILERYEGSATLSPKGRYVIGFDTKQRAWWSYDPQSGGMVEVSKGIPYPVHNELADTPDEAGPYGSGGWLEGDKAVLIYDRYDVWQCDPSGKSAPVCLTDGSGRMRNMMLRVVVLDRDQQAWKPGQSVLLSARNLDTEATGLYRDSIGGKDTPEKLIYGDKLFNISAKADKADRVLMTRQDFTEYPDLWLTNTSFENPIKLTSANPQQAEYNWGKTELVEWTSFDGEKLHGVLVKPENFDPGKKYPMIVYFYERLAQTLHQHRIPAPSASTINPTMYASNGYLVFMPDITYKTGYPGPSAEASILPGVTSLIARGYVDEKRIGLQGQSWGGYQVAYLVTRSNMFAAACAGAPVTNMFSAYGGIRWGSGVLRQMQYEQGQSRIGGSIWEKPLQYIENSPLFWADRVTTPLLMMNNDKDGAVPWYQGIEFYSALRRMQKPVWLVVYNGEDHNLVQTKNRKDWSVRLQQFFDHYLKGAPEPVWLATGIPATEKGKTMGFDLVKPDGAPAGKSGGN